MRPQSNYQASRSTRVRTHIAAGFSLIEVLVSVVVLALGLLGLAAVFPTVIRQQRLASDGVEGKSLERSISELVLKNSLLNAPSVGGPNQNGEYNVNDLRGWRTLTGDRTWSELINNNYSQPPTYWSYQGDWVVPNVITGTGFNGGINIVANTGDVVIGAPSAGGPLIIEGGVPIPLSERLVPTPDLANGVVPRYVYDLAARRIDVGFQLVSAEAGGGSQFFRNIAINDDRVEVAVFVRRIDSGVRVPPGESLSNVLLGRGVTSAARRIPVAADGANRPTNDGYGNPAALNYSGIVLVRFEFADVALPTADPIRTNRILVSTAADQTGPSNVVAILGLMEQVGQKFVSADGKVHTVRAIDTIQNENQGTGLTELVKVLIIEPEISRQVLDLSSTQGDSFAMLATPQVPAAVFVLLP